MNLNTRLFQRNIQRDDQKRLGGTPPPMHQVITGPIQADTAAWLNKNKPIMRNRTGNNDGRTIRAGENICSYTDYIGQTTTQAQLMPGGTLSECPSLRGKSMANLTPSELQLLLRTGNCEINISDSDTCPLFITAKEAGYERLTNELTDIKNLNYNRSFSSQDDSNLMEHIYTVMGY